jgi:hypothetical protein
MCTVHAQLHLLHIHYFRVVTFAVQTLNKTDYIQTIRLLLYIYIASIMQHRYGIRTFVTSTLQIILIAFGALHKRVHHDVVCIT